MTNFVGSDYDHDDRMSISDSNPSSAILSSFQNKADTRTQIVISTLGAKGSVLVCNPSSSTSKIRSGEDSYEPFIDVELLNSAPVSIGRYILQSRYRDIRSDGQDWIEVRNRDVYM
jgi:hypothetical protein